jgi:Domain of unknown function (DUF4350)
MTRKIVWSLVAVAVLATLAGLWFLQNFEQVPVTTREGPQKEALRNPYLALERLFSELGRPLERVQSPRLLDALPANGVLILDSNRRRNVDPARAERLLEWVNRGGYLITVPESDGNDPLLTKLGLTSCRSSPKKCGLAEENDEHSDDSGANQDRDPEPLEFSLPDSTIRYRYRQPEEELLSSSPEPIWQVGSGKTHSLLHYAWGRGQITVVDDLHFLSNWQIDHFDHAELIWALLQKYQPQGKLYLASRMDVPTLWQWLIESAWMALISGALLIGLWLWWIVPRFGGTLAVATSERRDLLAHLAAIGRSVWREGGLAHWLHVVRLAVHKRLTLRHPHLGQVETGRQHALLAKMATCPEKDIRSALTPGRTRTTAEFTTAMQTLQSLDQHL